MNNLYSENNKVTIIGTVESEPEFSHEVYGETFFSFILSVPRLSNAADKIVVTVSERYSPIVSIKVGDAVLINGQFRSYNNFTNVGNKLILTVFVKEIENVSDISEYSNPNSIFLNGYICKPPVYRTTPFGREIADILLAVNRSYNKSDYIPCIAWGRNAKFAESLETGTQVKIHGRIQSREYQKKISEEEFLTKVAYEVSVSKMEIETTIKNTRTLLIFKVDLILHL